MPVVSVLDSTMHYEASGNAPFVFLHAYTFADHARYLDAWFDALVA